MSDDLDFEPCSYCGAQIPADIVRCPKCGEYTDGGGPLAAGRAWTSRRIIITAVVVIVLLAFLAQILGGC